MANVHKGEVSLDAGGTIYTLKFSANSICELEDQLQKPIAKIAAELGDGDTMRMSTARAVFWGALREHHPDVDIKGAGSIMTDAGVALALEKVGEAFRVTFPEQAAVPEDSDAGEAARPSKAKAG